MAARALTLILVALLTLTVPLVESTHPAEARKRFRFRTVTRVFTNNGQIAIPGNGTATPYPAPLAAKGFKKGKIKDVNLLLRDFSHTFPEHVDILLVAPNGRNALVMSDVGGNANAVNLDLTLDDEAAAGLPSAGALASGAFRPTNFGAIEDLPAPAPVSGGAVALNTFDGGNPNGEWKLFVRDDTNMENGEFAGGWSLQIKARIKIRKKRR